MRLLLFDIDGTIMDSGRAGTRALNAAFLKYFSVENAFDGIRMSGKTDTEIMREALVKHRIATDGNIPLLMDIYVESLKKEISIPNPARHLKPGVKEALQALSGRKNIALGLLTGNIEQGARLKLSAFGLNKYFPFGAFGSDSEDRNLLLPVAVRRFNALFNSSAEYADCVVIGDTPRDISCAKPYGAFAFCVATGSYTVQELKAAGADCVMPDLSDTEQFIKNLNLS